MTGLDPEDADPSPAGPQDSQSSDQSNSGVRKAWDAWTSRPENNAALLQFGLAMLQPRAAGQSGIGSVANAIGQGAEASERNIASQQATEKQQSDIASKSAESSARTTTAKAYADQVAQGGTKKAPGMQASLAAQKAFNSWAAKPDDLTGMTGDPVTAALAKQFPDVKSKADVLNNPAALKAAREMFKNQLAEPDEDETPPTSVTPSAAPPAAAAPSAAPQPRVIYDKQGKAYQWDGIQGHKPVPM